MRYFKKSMPWAAHPYNQDRQKLGAKFKVTGIPALVVCDTDGKLLSNKGKEDLSNSTIKQVVNQWNKLYEESELS